MPPLRERARSRDVVVTVLVVGGLFLFYAAITRRGFPSYDGKVMHNVAVNLIEDQTFEVDPEVDEFGYAAPYSTYGIGVTFLVLPFVALQKAINPDDGAVVTLMNPMVLALAAGVIIRIGRTLGWSLLVAALTALAFGLLTSAVWQSTELLSEPGVTLCLLVGLLGCLWWQRGRAHASWLVGLGVGGAIMFRSDSILLVGLLVPSLLVFVGWRRLLAAPRALVGLVVPIAVAVAWLAWYNTLRFGSPLELGYEGYGFTTPLGEGLDRLVRQPGKGFFWYHPLLLGAIPGFVFLWRRNRALTVTIGVMVVARLVFFSKWFDPGGGVGWGPRLLFPLCALLVIPLGELMARIPSFAVPWRTAATVALCGLALAGGVVSFASVWVPYEQYFNIVVAHNPGETPEEWQQRVDDYFLSARGAHLAGNLRLVERSAPFPLAHWVGGPSAFGIAVLGAGVGCMATALVVAGRRPG